MVTAVNLETELHLFTAFQFSLEIFLMGSDQTPGWFLLLYPIHHQCSHLFQLKMKLGVATMVVKEETESMTIDHG